MQLNRIKAVMIQKSLSLSSAICISLSLSLSLSFQSRAAAAESFALAAKCHPPSSYLSFLNVFSFPCILPFLSLPDLCLSPRPLFSVSRLSPFFLSLDLYGFISLINPLPALFSLHCVCVRVPCTRLYFAPTRYLRNR